MNGTTGDLTPGTMAKLMGVAPRTISKWCDRGEIPCRYLPGTRDRRVSKRDFISFLRDNGWEDAARRVEETEPVTLLVGTGPNLIRLVDGEHVLYVPDAFSTGTLAATRPLAAAVLDAQALGRQEALSLCRHLAALDPAPRLFALLAEDDGNAAAFSALGAVPLRHPVDPGRLAAALGDGEKS